MSNEQPEEVDLTSLVREIKLFFQSIGRFFKAVYASIKSFITHLFSKLKFIGLISIIGGLIGLIVHFTQNTQYQSSIVLKMNVDAREQLSTDISYINSLIEKKEHSDLSNLLNISQKEASTINGIEINPHIPEVERLKNYSSIYTSLDSNIRDIIGLDFDMVNTTSNLSYITNKFNITLKSTDPRIFAKIEANLLNFISKSEELNQMLKIEVSELLFRERTLIKQIADLDTLKNVLNNVLIEESKARNTQAQTTIQLNQSERKDKFDILEVHKRNRELADQLAEVSSKIKKLNSVYTVEAHFSEFGQISSFSLLIKVLIGLSVGIVFALIFIIFELISNS